MEAHDPTVLAKTRRDALERGVEMMDPASVFISPEATVEKGVSIGPNVQILGKSIIKSGAVIEGTAFIVNCRIEADAIIRLGVRMEDSVVGSKTAVGPFAHLRPGATLGEDVRVGNFVEIKKSTLSKGVKASHLTYIGDSIVGEDVNIGAGTITCNYDGRVKHQTVIEKNCFVGSDTVLVAPVTVKEGAYIGAGSVITEDVPADSLALTRPPMTIKEGWAERRRKRNQANKA